MATLNDWLTQQPISDEEINGTDEINYDDRDPYLEDDPGYRPCRCEDYPCCGH